MTHDAHDQAALDETAYAQAIAERFATDHRTRTVAAADFALVETLRTIPGFRVQQLGGFGRTASIKTRGRVACGASTVRIEGYGPPSKDGQRIGIVTRSGEGLDFDLMVTGHGPNFVDKQLVRETREFKFNCNLVLIDFFLRHGLADSADGDPAALRAALRPRLP